MARLAADRDISEDSPTPHSPSNHLAALPANMVRRGARGDKRYQESNNAKRGRGDQA